MNRLKEISRHSFTIYPRVNFKEITIKRENIAPSGTGEASSAQNPPHETEQATHQSPRSEDRGFSNEHGFPIDIKFLETMQSLSEKEYEKLPQELKDKYLQMETWANMPESDEHCIVKVEGGSVNVYPRDKVTDKRHETVENEIEKHQDLDRETTWAAYCECTIFKRTVRVPLTDKEAQDLFGGTERAIDDVLPDTPAPMREIFLTGMTPAEFDKAFRILRVERYYDKFGYVPAAPAHGHDSVKKDKDLDRGHDR